jgi:hypothetical protein
MAVMVGVGWTKVVLTAHSPKPGKVKVSQTLKLPASAGWPLRLKRAPQMVLASPARGAGAPAALAQLIVPLVVSYKLVPLGL